MVVTSREPDLAGKVGLQFGNAGFFIVIDTETGQLACVDKSDV